MKIIELGEHIFSSTCQSKTLAGVTQRLKKLKPTPIQNILNLELVFTTYPKKQKKYI